MYLWVLGPIYLFYIHRHGRCYLRMSYLFKIKMVLGFALILLYTFNVAMPLWRIHQGMPQAPELLIHPTVWLTTMVTAALCRSLACSQELLSCWYGSVREVGASPAALHPFSFRVLPPS